MAHRLGYWLTLLSTTLAAGFLAALAHAAPEAAAAGPTGTPAALAAKTAPFLVESSAALSPDGQWLAVTVALFPQAGGGENYYRQLRVVKADHTAVWTPVDQWAPWGLGYPLPVVVRWSADSRYLYFADEIIPDGAGEFHFYADVRRLDLRTGKVISLIAQEGTALGISPDGRSLAFAGATLRVRDLRTGREREWAFAPAAGQAPARAASLAWSPDGRALLLAVLTDHGGCDPDCWDRAIVRVDASSGALKPLPAAEGKALRLLAWPEPGRAQVADEAGVEWWLDTATGQLTPSE